MAGSGQRCLEIFVKCDYIVGIFQVHKRITLLFFGNRKKRVECPDKGVGQMLSTREGRIERAWQLC